MFAVPDDLRRVRDIYRAEGFDIRFVGGCVRDHLLGETPKDFDLCTDADLLEEADIFAKHKIRYVPTGAAHGTVTLLLKSGAYEITVLRTESEHDGRHATVVATRDWVQDLGRRDLTINAMAMTFEGELIDPFGGQDDLAARRMRFVGDADRRMQEDFLRILRWLRFSARLAPQSSLDPETFQAMERNLSGLKMISRERVWSEWKRLICAEGALGVISDVIFTDLFRVIELQAPAGAWERFGKAHRAKSVRSTPEALMAAWLGDPELAGLQGRLWRWSNDETALTKLLAKTVYRGARPVPAREMCALKRVPREHAYIAALMAGDLGEAEDIATWTIPVCPIDGDDLIGALGLNPGPELGAKLALLKRAWAASDFCATKAELLEMAA